MEYWEAVFSTVLYTLGCPGAKPDCFGHQLFLKTIQRCAYSSTVYQVHILWVAPVPNLVVLVVDCFFFNV